MVMDFKIGNHPVGTNHPCLIIAEAGVNHNGNIDTAHQMVRAAAQAGVDAVKFQTFKAENLATAIAPKAGYQAKATGEKENQFEMLHKLELSEADFRDLFDECRKNDVLFLSSPFDEDSADLLDSIGVKAFKIPSGEINNIPFLTHLAKKGKPLILSTGMSYLDDVDVAVRAVRAAGNQDLVLLHCTSDYPADPTDVNLRAMTTLGQAFQVPVGYSDHTTGLEVSLAAVAMGACVIEKHFTLDRTLPGPDHQASLEPPELEALVRGIRKVEVSLGNGRKEPAEHEVGTAAVARKSIVAKIDLQAGTILDDHHLVMMRPGTGLPPTMLPYVLGRKVRSNIPAGTLISFEMLA